MNNMTEFQTTEDLKLPCIVKVYADWCKPCHKIEPEFLKLYNEYKNNFNFYKADVDVCKDFVNEFEIRSIPKLFLMTKNETFITQNIKELKEKVDSIFR